MENKIYNDDVERIVNDPWRHASIANSRRKRRLEMRLEMFGRATICAAVAIFSVFLGIAEWVEFLVSVFAFAIFSMGSAFFVGRVFENIKIRGWK